MQVTQFKYRDLQGERFNKLVVKCATTERKGGSVVWSAVCDCGNYKLVSNHCLRVMRLNRTGSCGCATTPACSVRTYTSYRGMLRRCFDGDYKFYKDYGGRGITVCKSWLSIKNFVFDMGERPHGRTLDRMNVNDSYRKGNCRWATKDEQAANTRRTRLVDIDGVVKTGMQWADILNIPSSTFYRHLDKGIYKEVSCCTGLERAA